MSKEVLLALCREAERLVESGAASAACAAGLRQRSREVAKLAAKVPALGPLAEAARRLAEAAPEAAAGALLPLLAMCRQVRNSVAGSGVEGELETLSKSGPWRTAMPWTDLRGIIEAIIRKSKPFDYEEEARANDLRLLDPLLRVLRLAKPDDPTAESVREYLLPRFGRAAATDLRRLAEESLEGPNAPGRLGLLLRLDPTATLPLLDRALAARTPDRRVTILEDFYDLLPGTYLERHALELLHTKSSTRREGVVWLLAKSVSPEGAAALLDHFGDGFDADSGHVTDTSSNPHLLDMAFERLPAARLKSERLGEKFGDARKLKGPHPADELGLLRVIFRHHAPRRAEVARLLLDTLNRDSPDFRKAALDGLRRLNDPPAEVSEVLTALLRSHLGSLKNSQTDETIDRIFAALARVSAEHTEGIVEDCWGLLKRCLGPNPRPVQGLEIPLALVVRQARRRPGEWLARLAGLFAAPVLSEAERLIPVLGHLGPVGRHLLPAMLAANAATPYHQYPLIFEAMSRLDPGGDQMIPVGMAMLQSRQGTDIARGLSLLTCYPGHPDIRQLRPEFERLRYVVPSAADSALARLDSDPAETESRWRKSFPLWHRGSSDI